MKVRPSIQISCIKDNINNFLPVLLLLLFLGVRLPLLHAQPGKPSALSSASIEAVHPNDKAMGKSAVINSMVSAEESDTFEIGCEFTLSFPITITELGVYDLNGDGLAVNSIVSIWNTLDHRVIVSAEIVAGTEAALINDFRYVNIPDTRLQPGTYIMSAFSPGEGYGMNSGITATTGSGINLNAGVFNTYHEYPENYNYSFAFFGANFLYTAAEPVITDPGSITESIGTWELGCKFIVNAPILISHLGVYDSQGDGLEAEVPVTIWKESDQSVVISGIVPAGNASYHLNNFRYCTIEPTYLEPGAYRMSAFHTNDLYARNLAALSTTAPEVTITGGAFATTHSYPVNSNTAHYFGANFLFSNPQAAIINPMQHGQANGPWELGYEFEVSETLVITGLGTLDYNNDGLAMATIVTLWNIGDESILLRDTIPGGTASPLINGFRYTSIPDYTLQPGTYRLSSYFAPDDFVWNNDLTSESIEEINITGGVYRPTNEQGYPTEHGSEAYFGPNFLVKQSCAAAGRPVIDGSAIVCPGDNVILNAENDNLNDSYDWHWYINSCGGIPIGTGGTISVSPTNTTNLYIRGEGNCFVNGPCDMFTIEVVNDVTISREGNILKADIPNADYQWVDCNQGNIPVTGATDVTFAPTHYGTYAVQVNLESCTLESECYEFSFTGTGNYIESELKVFPNPVHDILTIETGEFFEKGIIEVTDLRGVVIFKQTLDESSSQRLDFRTLASDIYIVRLYDDSRIVSLKIYKE
jgi:hypothetical protein